MTNLVVIEPPDNLPIEEEEQRMASSTGCGGSSVNSCLPELAHIMFTTALGNDDGDDDAYKDVGDAALDSILETTVAEVTAALSHTDDAEEVANATTAALDAACAAAAQLCEPTLPPNDYELDTTTLLLPPPPVATIAPSVPAVASNRNKRSLEEQQLNLIQNVNRNVAAAGAAVATKAPPSGRRNSDIPVAIVKNYQVGRWSQDERILFLYGLQTFGKGRWKKISSFVPNRSVLCLFVCVCV